MRVLHVPFHYYPEAVGGTEVYVASLAEELAALGVESQVAAPGAKTEHYLHSGKSVWRFRVSSQPNLKALYGAGDEVAAEEFVTVLERTRPEVVHLHAMSPAVSCRVQREISKRGIPTVFTCHIPGVICPRGTLLENGRNQCDGRWTAQRCAACALQGRGLPPILAKWTARLSGSFASSEANARVRGRAGTVLGMVGLQVERRSALLAFLESVDRIVAVSEWLRQLILDQGVSPEKVSLCRHGSTNARISEKERAIAAVPLKLAFLGRLEASKGLHILLDALSRSPLLDVRLDVFAIVQQQSTYVEEVKRYAARDRRVRLLAAVDNADVPSVLRGYHAVVIPSQWLETGPLVIYDAFEAGIPAIGSDRGGIAELLQHEYNGLLVRPDEPVEWLRAVTRLINEPALLERLSSNARTERTMAAVASEMASLYREVVRINREEGFVPCASAL